MFGSDTRITPQLQCFSHDNRHTAEKTASSRFKDPTLGSGILIYLFVATLQTDTVCLF